MYIESVAIESFGSYKNYSVSFDKGINIIEGPNESGKTTLGAFIKFIFYGLSKKASAHSSLTEAARYRSWEDELASGSIVFTHGENRYRIERRLRAGAKSSAGEIIKIIDLSTNTECFKGEHPGRLFFGVDEDAFSQSAYVGQADGGKVNGKAVSVAIENMLFAADESVSIKSASKKLDDARILLKYKVRRGGKIAELEDKIEDLSVDLESAENANKLLISKESEKRELVYRFEKETENLSVLKKQIDRAKEKEILAKFEYFDTLCEDSRECERQYNAAVENATHNGFLPNGDYIQELESTQNAIENTNKQIVQLAEEKASLGSGTLSNDDRIFIKKLEEDGGIETIQKNMKTFSSKRSNQLLIGALALVLALFGAVLAIYCFVGFENPSTDIIEFLGISAMLSGFCALSVTAAFGLFCAFMLISSSNAHKKRAAILERYLAYNLEEIEEFAASVERRRFQQISYDERKEQLDEKSTKLSSEHKALTEKQQALFAKWGKDHSSPNISCISLIREINELISQIDSAKSKKEKADFAQSTYAKTLEGHDRNAILVSLSESEKLGDLTTEISEAMADLEKRSLENQLLSEEIRKIELEIAKIPSENPFEISEQIERLISEKSELEISHDAYMLAIESIENASEKLRREISPRLSMQASAMMRKETKGKYEQLGIGEDFTLSFGIDTSGVGNVVTRDIEYLSAGTKDLAYITLRIALIGLLFTKAKPPVLFDESFARLDDARLENMLSVLDDVAKSGCQIFIFTSQTRDAEIMKKIGDCKHILLENK